MEDKQKYEQLGQNLELTVLLRVSDRSRGEPEIDGRKAKREDAQKFISFLRYCAERLERGDQVQVIWHDYQNLTQEK